MSSVGRIEQVRDIVTFSGARRKQATSNNAARSSFPPRPKYSITNECSAIKQPLSLSLLRLQHATDVAPRVKDLVTRVFLTRLRLPPPPLPPPNGFNPSLALPRGDCTCDAFPLYPSSLHPPSKDKVLVWIVSKVSLRSRIALLGFANKRFILHVYLLHIFFFFLSLPSF